MCRGRRRVWISRGLSAEYPATAHEHQRPLWLDFLPRPHSHPPPSTCPGRREDPELRPHPDTVESGRHAGALCPGGAPGPPRTPAWARSSSVPAAPGDGRGPGLPQSVPGDVGLWLRPLSAPGTAPVNRNREGQPLLTFLPPPTQPPSPVTPAHTGARSALSLPSVVTP